MTDEPLLVAEDRIREEDNLHTGIYVRARWPNGDWGAADISQLERDSLHHWLRSRGGDNPWAENVVMILMGYPQRGPTP